LDDPIICQLVFRHLEVRGFINGRAAFSVSRKTTGPIGAITVSNQDSLPLPAKLLASEIVWRPEYFGYQTAVPMRPNIRPRFHSDVLLRVDLPRPTDEQLSLRLYADALHGQTGYQMRVAGNQAHISRNDAHVGSVELDNKYHEATSFGITSNGRVVQFSQGDTSVASIFDVNPMREGAIEVHSNEQVLETANILVHQLWDSACFFNSDWRSSSDLCAWRPVRGKWTIAKDAVDLTGWLVGRVGRESDVELRYKTPLDESELMLQAAFVRSSLAKSQRIVLNLDLGEHAPESVEVKPLENGLVECVLSRGDRRVPCHAERDAASELLVLTLLRTRNTIVLEQNHVPIGEIAAVSPGNVKGLSLLGHGNPGDELKVLCLCVQSDPISPSRIPSALKRELEFYRDVVSNRVVTH
jgi:hypothetical protein